jgi:DNA-binding winged helix-turn-helix (wHTH) protein/tetratricopeptide (TPR) repeat protein
LHWLLLAKKMPVRSGADLMNDRFSADDLLRMDASARIPPPIDLAHTPPFQLGDAEVLPASREIFGHGESAVLEPLVMQVLVALHLARGETLSRDDLIDACWGGRAVTDDALNRVITRLRALARDFGGFEIKTITKVGYRLVENDTDRSTAGASAGTGSRQGFAVNRRTLIAGGGAVAAAATGMILWKQPWRHHPPAEAVRLFRLGRIAQWQGVSNQARQAISFYEQALRIDPLYAEAWGALAIAQTHILEGFGEPGTEGVPAQLVSAARRALQLDPDNADAQLALILLKPYFRNWATTEVGLRRLNARYPRHWFVRGRLAVLLYDVGRLNEGIELHGKLDAGDHLLPIRDVFWANGLLNAGRLEEAERVLDSAHERWPAHPSLWTMRYKFLLFSGQPQAAAAFIMDPESKPSGLDPKEIEQRLRLARAADTRAPADVESSIDDFRKIALADVGSTPFAAAVFALLGRPDLTFDSLERYYFNGGTFGPSSPIGPYTRRQARDLFSPPLTPLRSDPRFMSILQRVGLEDYWRRTGTLPDYRRTA